MLLGKQDEPRVFQSKGISNRHGHARVHRSAAGLNHTWSFQDLTTVRPTARTTTGPIVRTTSTRPAAHVLTVASPVSPLRPVASSCGAPCSPTLALSLCPRTKSCRKAPSPRRSSSRSSRSSLPRVRATLSSSTLSSANRPTCARRTFIRASASILRTRRNPAFPDNAWVYRRGSAGQAVSAPLITEGIMKGVVEADHGWWFRAGRQCPASVRRVRQQHHQQPHRELQPRALQLARRLPQHAVQDLSLHAGEQRGHAWHRSRGERRFHEDSRIRQSRRSPRTASNSKRGGRT